MPSLITVSELIAANRRDVLSVALDVDPAKPEHQTANPAYRIWALHALQRALEAAPGPARHDIQEMAGRIQARLEHGPAAGHGLVMLAAPGLWHEVALPDAVPNRVAYGRPDLLPLLWAGRVYRPWALVIVDRGRATIVAVSLNETTIIREESLELDTAHWRFKSGRPRTSTKAAAVGVGRGIQRDAFEDRVDEHVRRFWHEAAGATAEALARLSIDRVVIAGPARAANAVREFLPETVRATIVGAVPLHSHASIADARAQALPRIVAHDRRQEARLVADLRDRAEARTGGVLGVEATLEAVSRGEVKVLAATRELEASVWECDTCASVTAHPGACAACGGPAAETSLRQVLPVLARRHGAHLEVIGPAASSLPDGLGALLRYVPQVESPVISGGERPA